MSADGVQGAMQKGEGKSLSDLAKQVDGLFLPSDWDFHLQDVFVKTIDGSGSEDKGGWVGTAALKRSDAQAARLSQMYIIGVPMKEGEKDVWRHVVVVDVDVNFSLKEVPVVGQVLKQVTIKHVNLLCNRVILTEQSSKKLNELLKKAGVTKFALPVPKFTQFDDDIAVGAHLLVTYGIGTAEQPALSVDLPKGGEQRDLVVGSGGGAAAGGSSWGSLSKVAKGVRRINFAYVPAVPTAKGSTPARPGRIVVSLDAAGELGPLTLEFKGAGVVCPVDTFKPSATLSGVGVSFLWGTAELGIRVAGGLVLNPLAWADDHLVQLDGAVMVYLPAIAATVAGSYRQMKGQDDPSVFLFGELDFSQMVGGGFGPPCFTVRRVMLGGGYNSEVRLPKPDEVEKFPLVAGLTDETAVGKDPTPLQVLDKLTSGDTPWITPKAQNFWAAGGLEFETFKILAKVLLLVEFGNDWSVSVLGLVTLQLPLDSKDPAAKLVGQLAGQLEHRSVKVQQKDAGGKDVAVGDEETVLTASVVLGSNSYLFSDDARLTGGVAMRVWTQGPHAGDFVFTLGGYAPSYKVPDHYPNVPRVGVTFNIGPVTMRAEVYFAFTPRAVMAGGNLSMVQNLGWLRWWLSVHVDGWIGWDPFTAYLSLGASVGIAADLNIGPVHVRPSVELGVDLALWWCPDFGGHWSVSLWFASISGDFGSDLQQKLPVDWDQFKRTVPKPVILPRRNTEIPEEGTAGPYKPVPDKDTAPIAGEEANGQAINGSQNGFTFSATIQAPAKEVYVRPPTGEPVREAKMTDAVHIREMKRSDVASRLDVQFSYLARQGEPLPAGHPVFQDAFWEAWSYKPTYANLPFAKWGDPKVEAPKSTSDLVPHQLTGLEITVPAPTARCAARHDNRPLQADAADIEMETIYAYDDERDAGMPLTAQAAAQGSAAAFSPGAAHVVKDGIASSPIQQTRGQLFEALKGAGCLRTSKNDGLDRYAREVLATLTDDPLLEAAA
ncbi:DUF6603 domain-containing protein [Streptomyces iconiensis]|uniref:DUF6603 domain-containing protein n=1 Tax=Streptomyces iconiensis TaxID=1384038 RepID=A0ABT7A4I1_9ACTN|nr:DUF6603 domain-containing protein [Streptomyces iconiensis]MDJ1136253.1 hypothetical protein [Streptomyces iconiensis]